MNRKVRGAFFCAHNILIARRRKSLNVCLVPTVYKLRDLETGAPYLVLPGMVTVGRHEDADIQLADESVSRRHARIQNTESGVFVQDLGSSNGTFVSSVRIAETTPVQLGAEITFGNMRFRLDPEVGSAGTADEPIPQPRIDWEKLQRGTNKIPSKDSYAAKTKTSPTRVSITESGHLVTVQSAAFPGGAMFPKTTKTPITPTGVPASPPPAPPRARGVQTEVAGSSSAKLDERPVTPAGPPWLMVLLAGMGIGIILGLVLARILFVH